MAVRPGPNGHIHLISNADGRKVWGTDTPPVQLVPDLWQSIPISFSFPDLPKDIAYFWDRTGSGGYSTGYGMSVAKILPQELTLPNVVLGTLAAPLVNYVDWRIVLNWAKQPSPARGWPVMSPVVRGKQTSLQGGSAILEISGGFKRMIHVGIVGQQIILSRRQSTRNQDEFPHTGWTTSVQTEGWTYGTSTLGLLSYRIDGVVGHASQYLGGAWRGGPRSASLADPTDYSSIWTGTLLMKPGRANTSI